MSRHDGNKRPQTAGQRRRRRLVRSRWQHLEYTAATDPGRRARPHRFFAERDAKLAERPAEGDPAARRRRTFRDVRTGFIGRHPAMTSLPAGDAGSVLTDRPGPQPVPPLLLIQRSPQPASDGDNKETASHAA